MPEHRAPFALHLFLALSLPLSAACSGDDDDDTGGATGDGGESGWSVSYMGDLTGEAGGSVAVVQTQTTSMESVSLAGEDHDSDESLVGTYQYARGDAATGSKTFLTLSLTLADGTTCSQDPYDDVLVVANVSSAEEDTYAATFAGELLCDTDLVEVEGWFRD